MKTRKPTLYFHQPTGQIMEATKAQAKLLDDNWKKLQFTKNEKGEDVMRFTFTDSRGVTATVDVKETEAKPDGDRTAE